MSFQYYQNVTKILDKVITKEKQNIIIAVNYLTEAIKHKKQIFAFGASHAGILSEEMFYRAGGLAVINPVFNPDLMLNVRPVTMTSEMERLEGFGKIIAANAKLSSGDIVIIHSVSGRNPTAIDFALYAKENGVKVIAITNLTYSKSVTSRHSSKKRLFELADVVIDNHGDIGDATVKVENLSQKVAPTSTVVGATIVNILVSETAISLSKQGITPPVFFSANMDGGDDHNQKILNEYRDIINYQ